MPGMATVCSSRPGRFQTCAVTADRCATRAAAARLPGFPNLPPPPCWVITGGYGTLPAQWLTPASSSTWKLKPAERPWGWTGVRRPACGSMSCLPEIELILHALLAALVVWAGVQDWRRREVADWLTWPLFVLGLGAAVYRAFHLGFLPLTISIFVLVVWYFNWLGGADARVLVGLWGLWPLAGLLGMICTGIWGLVLVLRKREKEHIPALVTVAAATLIQLMVELFRLCKFT